MAHLENKIVLFNSSDGDVSLEVLVNANNDEVWLSKEQMTLLFGRDRTVISRHISNLYKEGEVDKDSTCAKFA